MKRLRIIVCVLILILVFVGCSKQTRGTSENRFVVLYRQGMGFDCNVGILEDTETGVQYLFVKNGPGAGLTIMPEVEQ